ncbi:hypothetical protein Tco_1526307 [Tanacetum coccineum]
MDLFKLAIVLQKAKQIQDFGPTKTKADIASLVADAVKKEQEHTRAALSSQVSHDLAINVPLQVFAFLKNYMNNNILHVHPTSSLSSLIPDLQYQLYFQMKDDVQAHQDDFAVWIALKYKYKKPAFHVEPCRVNAFCRQDHEDHHDDNARLKGESSAKRQRTSVKKQQQEYDSWSKDQGNDDDQVPTEEITQDFLDESWILTTNYQKCMQDALDDMMRIRCNSGEEHAYHLDQMKRYIENRIVWESKTEEVTEQVPVGPSLLYRGCDRNQKAPPRARKVIKRFKLEARYAVQHWKGTWVKISYIKEQLTTRPNPDDVYSDQKIVELIRIQYDQGHRQEFMKEIYVRRADGTMSSFSKSDYKYLNKKREMHICSLWFAQIACLVPTFAKVQATSL